MSFTQHFPAISQVFSHFMHICSFQQCQYCEIGNVSMGFSKSLMPKILYKSLIFDSWFDKIFGIRDLENPILTFPPHSIVSILSHVTTLTFVVTCDYIDFFLANVTVNHNVHTFTIIVHGYLFHSFLINVVNYNAVCLFWSRNFKSTTRDVFCLEWSKTVGK